MIEQILNTKNYLLPKHAHEGGATKETHFAFYNKKKYVLRICNNEKSKKYCHEAFKKFGKTKIMPRLIEEKDNYFLIEFIIGRDLEEVKGENNKTLKQVGRILALVNAEKKEFDYKASLKKYLRYISKNKVLSKEDLLDTKKLLKKLSKIRLITCLDISDLTADNFRLSKEGKVYLVDIGAIKPKFAGFGITKAFFQWIKTEKQQQAFKEGYNSISSIDFYSGDYKILSELFFVIQVIYYKHLQNKNYDAYLKRLSYLLSYQYS